MRVISDEGLAFIKAYEGFRQRASRLPDGRWLLGYSSVEENTEGRDGRHEISQGQADARLRRDLAVMEALVDELIFAPLSQRQVDALVSLAFSIGEEAFRGCGVAEALNEGRPLDAALVFDRWHSAPPGSRPVDALVRRRAAEKALFLTPDEGPVPAPSALLRATLRREALEAPPAAHLGAVLPSMLGVAADARGNGRDWAGAEQLPSAHPLRRDVALRVDATGGARSVAGAWPVFSVVSAAPPSASAQRPALGQWPWLLSGGGLALAAVGLGNIQGPPGTGLDAIWAVALVAGVLALGTGGYFAARRVMGLRH